jgi:hypothetical protein
VDGVHRPIGEIGAHRLDVPLVGRRRSWGGTGAGPGPKPGACVVQGHAAACSQTVWVLGVGVAPAESAGGTSSCMTDVRRFEMVTITTMTTAAMPAIV